MTIATSSPHSPRVIALEGPAGVGKSSVSRELVARLRERGIQAGFLPEFSVTSLGEALQKDTHFGSRQPDWCLGLGGLLAFLADKVHQWELATHDDPRLWISDRSLLSQLVLGIRGLEEPRRTVGSALIQDAQEWALKAFAQDSVLIFLNAPLPVLQDRLERRLGRSLTVEDQENLCSEIAQYEEISQQRHGWTAICLSSTATVAAVAAEIETRLEG